MSFVPYPFPLTTNDVNDKFGSDFASAGTGTDGLRVTHVLRTSY
jgi:hypothetical protein